MELALDKVPLRIELLFLAAVLGVLALFVLAVLLGHANAAIGCSFVIGPCHSKQGTAAWHLAFDLGACLALCV